jgi:hypothetical protein
MRRQLGQLTPDGTAAVTLFQPTSSGAYNIDLINIANVGSGSIKVSLFHDRDGTTYSTATALLWNTDIPAGGLIQFEVAKGYADYTESGSIGVQTNTANDATFTCYGEIKGERL